jgi:hypothetical protein
VIILRLEEIILRADKLKTADLPADKAPAS